jgi:peptidyl-prolyl cis-trans isomerase B (cyclophilin B)
MRALNLILPVVIVAVIVIAGAMLVMKSDDTDNKSTPQAQSGGAVNTASSSGFAATPQAPAAAAPTQPAAAPPAPTPAAPSAPAAAPIAGDPSCTGPTLASLKRGTTKSWPAPPARVIDPNKAYTTLIKTSKGDITATLAAKDAPNTVNNFIFLACNGFYDGLTWHRVVPNFVIQGGDPAGNGTGGPGYKFNNETSPTLKHETGTLAMANAGPNTNGSQFYITRAPQPALDGGYNVFGKVTDGMNVVNAIVMGDKIESISIREN